MDKAARVVYLLASGVLLVAILVQAYLAGAVYVARELSSSYHVDLGHSLPLPIIVLIVSAYLGRLPGRMKWLTWALFGTYFVQVYVLMWLLRQSAPAVAALHPVLALLLFALSAWLALRAWRLLREGQPSSGSRPQGSPSAAG